jgi:hypothetical protein
MVYHCAQWPPLIPADPRSSPAGNKVMRHSQLRASFESWKLPNGTTLPGKFTIAFIGDSVGKWAYRYTAVLCPTMEPFYDKQGKPLSFAESKLEEGKATIRKMFETQLTEWQ